MHSFPVPMCHYYQRCSFIMCDDDNILWNSYTGEERPNSRVNLLKTNPDTCLCVTSNITLILYPFLRCHGVDIPSPWDWRHYIIMNRLELLLFLVFGFAYSWFNNWLSLCWLFYPWRNVFRHSKSLPNVMNVIKTVLWLRDIMYLQDIIWLFLLSIILIYLHFHPMFRFWIF